MTKSKILFGSLVVILATIFIYSCAKDSVKTKLASPSPTVETRGGGDLLDLLGTACVPSSIVIPGACNDTTFVDTLVVTNHPMYPGCSFKLIFKRQECKLGSSFEDVTIGDFQIFEHNCPQFSTDINSKYNQSIWSSYIINFETGMWNKIRDYLISQRVTGTKYLCGQGKWFNINFIRASCYRYASIIQKNGLGISTKLSCGSQCCQRHTTVCRKSDGSLQITQNDVTNPFTIDCSDPAFLTDPPIWIKGKITWITPCSVTCPN